MEKIFNGVIEYPTDQEITNTIDFGDINTSIKIIEVALEQSCRSGIFTMKENFLIHKCVNRINNYINEKNNLFNSNNNGDTTPNP